LGVASHKKITLFLWKDVKTSLVHFKLRFMASISYQTRKTFFFKFFSVNDIRRALKSPR
jgi:hypothetical protein